MSRKTVPFANLYKPRTVAETDSKACFICYKPTPNVLITLKTSTSTKLDFFYICKSHLNDTNFCKVRYVTDDIENVAMNREIEIKINDLKRDQFKLKEKISRLEKSILDSNGQLSKIMNYFSKQKDESKKEELEKDKEDDSTKLTIAKNEYDNVSKELTTLSLQNLKYQLDQSYYQSRLQKHFEIEKKLQQQENLKNPNYFPSVSHLPKPS